MILNNYLFNFSASHSGGGYKRLNAFSNYFDKNGGANFIVNTKLTGIEDIYKNNKYFFISENKLERFFNFSFKFKKVIDNFPELLFYYSYGIPINKKIGKLNWFHISNVLPFQFKNLYIPFKRQIELLILRIQIQKSINIPNFISVESLNSFKYFNNNNIKEKLIISVNGSDDEIAHYRCGVKKNDIQNYEYAITVGTYFYKCIDDVYKVYKKLSETKKNLYLIIVGSKNMIPKDILQDKFVIVKGILNQQDVCNLLIHSNYYITCSLIENSYNAASEGVFLSKESYISKIGPHIELLKDINYDTITNFETRLPLLKVSQSNLNVSNLKSWNSIINDMLNILNNAKK